MKRLFTIFAMFGLTFGLTAQNTIIATADFDRVSVSHAFNIILIPSDRNEVIVPENLELPRGVETEDIISVNRGTLTIALPESFLRRNNRWNTGNERQPDIRVYFKSLNSLSLSGASSATSEGTIRANTFQASLAGSGRANLNIVADNVTSRLSGSGRLTLTGRANEHNINVSGSGRVDAENVLETKSSRVSVSGSGRASVSAESVRVSLSGSGRITLQAREVTGSISGSGRVMLNADAQRNISTSGSGRVQTL
ncbi:MAG: DUF2807 domain-containing protein [Bacteroidales bacterium]|nr:DUF2807 domain-containing protein [Bacteroidales bacterium]